MVELQHGDATSIVNTLNALYQRVNVTASGNTSLITQRTQTQQGFLGPIAVGSSQQASVALLPLPRFNSILMAAPKSRVEEVKEKIRQLDRPTPTQGQLTPFPLKKASARTVSLLVQNFYNQRSTPETALTNQIRVTYDESTNTIFVQAGPADLKEISDLIYRIDNTVTNK